MKIFVLSPDINGHVEPTLQWTMFKYLHSCETVEEADVVVIPVSFIPSAEINPRVLELQKPWVMIDFLEYFNLWDEETTHVIGVNDPPVDHYKTDQWNVLHEWVRANPPIVYFKRELLAKDRTETLLPAEWPCSIPIPPLQSQEEFNARAFEVFNCWGLSNYKRAKFHGEIFSGMGEHRLHVASSFEQMDYLSANRHEMGDSRPWATIFTPHFMRISIDLLMVRQTMAKVACSFPGSGTKCFRHTEASVGCIMALPSDPMAWGIPWLHGDNCIRMTADNEFHSLVHDIPNLDLYGIYVRGDEAIRRYQSTRYVNEYMIPNIQKFL